MDREPLLFMTDPGQELATARLLFAPTKTIRLTGPADTPQYEEGRDFLWKPGCDLLTLTADSRIPFKTYAQMHPRPGEPNSIPTAVDGQSDLLFSEGGYFHQLQVQATYEHRQKWTLGASWQAGRRLSATSAKLKAKTPFKLVVLGDSIAEGGNASGFVNVAPHQPAFPGLIAAGLESHYRLPAGILSLVNLSVGGKTSDWGLTMVEPVGAQRPDLLIIAFGMNDACVNEPEIFGKNIANIIAGVQKVCPQAQFILVSPMVGNPEWKGLHMERFAQNLDQLGRLTTEGVELADVTTPWQGLTRSKKFTDLTGNGVNHPNDFGHRLYAQVILQLLPPPDAGIIFP